MATPSTPSSPPPWPACEHYWKRLYCADCVAARGAALEREVERLRAVNADLNDQGEKFVEEFNYNLKREKRLWDAALAILGKLDSGIPTSMDDSAEMAWTKTPPTVGQIRALRRAVHEPELSALAAAEGRDG